MEGFLGEIRMFAGDYAPQGWALCNGALLPLANNQALYSLLGTTYGGNGVDTFAVPDLRGRAPMSTGTGVIPGTGQSLTPRALGNSVGNETVALNQNNLPAHTHPMPAGGAGATNAPAGKLPGTAATNLYSQTTTAAVNMNLAMVSPAGGGGLPHNNMMPTTCINFIIALSGIYPTAG